MTLSDVGSSQNLGPSSSTKSYGTLTKKTGKGTLMQRTTHTRGRAEEGAGSSSWSCRGTPGQGSGGVGVLGFRGLGFRV